MFSDNTKAELALWWATGNNAKHTITGAILFLAGVWVGHWLF